MIGRIASHLRSFLPGPGGDDPDGEADAEGGDGGADSIWDAIPSWQYGGLHVHQGGFSRAEQEEAIEELRRQAAEIEEDPSPEDGPYRG